MQIIKVAPDEKDCAVQIIKKYNNNSKENNLYAILGIIFS